MKQLLASMLAVALTACVSVPVDRTFPKAPDDLKTACPDLQLLDPTTTRLSDVVNTVTTNYGQYQSCQNKVAVWIEWYNTQKEIFDSVK
jgi:starvation-inducible outer membrane lipoprotein